MSAEGRRIARIRNYLNKQDLFWSYREWPEWARITVTKAHKRNSERYNLFVFLTMNGLNPEHAARWARMTDVRNGFQIIEDIRDKTDRHVDQMKRQLEDGTLFLGGKRVFCMVEQRPITMNLN
jgi:hypothetical protein